MSDPFLRRYEYVGPKDLLELGDVPFQILTSDNDVKAWIATEGHGPFTFVVDPTGFLRVAARGVEHVQVAQRNPVLAAGEVTFDDGPAALFTNQSTGFCPEPSCFDAVRAASQRVGLQTSETFERGFIFRRCVECEATNIVKEEWFVCAECDTDLPLEWNYAD